MSLWVPEFRHSLISYSHQPYEFVMSDRLRAALSRVRMNSPVPASASPADDERYRRRARLRQ